MGEPWITWRGTLDASWAVQDSLLTVIQLWYTHLSNWGPRSCVAKWEGSGADNNHCESRANSYILRHNCMKGLFHAFGVSHFIKMASKLDGWSKEQSYNSVHNLPCSICSTPKLPWLYWHQTFSVEDEDISCYGDGLDWFSQPASLVGIGWHNRTKL